MWFLGCFFNHLKKKKEKINGGCVLSLKNFKDQGFVNNFGLALR
jgi:hypothetical protein